MRMYSTCYGRGTCYGCKLNGGIVEQSPSKEINCSEMFQPRGSLSVQNVLGLRPSRLNCLTAICPPCYVIAQQRPSPDICMCMYTYVCICMYVYVCMYMYVCVCMYVCMCMYVYVCMCMYVCVCMYVCMCMYVYVCVCMYVYVCVFIVLLTSSWYIQTLHITTNVPPSRLPHYPHIPTFTPHCHCRVHLVTAETRGLEE